MTALKKYQRLEASGLWRPSPDEQRRDVIVSIGDATLVITDTKDQPLTHWSLAAVERENPGARPAVFYPDGDPGETLELGRDEEDMIRAIEKLRGAISRARPKPGRLRLLSVIASCLAVALLAVFWLPGAMKQHTLSVVPDITRQDIGRDLLSQITRVAGPACNAPTARPALNRLAARTGTRQLVILPAGVKDSLALPGDMIILNRAIIEDFEEPDVAAGYILTERLRAVQTDPLADVLDKSGVRASFRLITTGMLAPETLDRYAQTILTEARPMPSDDAILEAFEQANLRSTPYAYARDITGESTLGLIEADPMAGQTPAPILSDRDWLILQSICES